jgi:hypothetical protein
VSQQARLMKRSTGCATADTLDRLDTDNELLTEPEEVGLTLEVPLPEEVRRYRSLWWCPRRCLGHWAC